MHAGSENGNRATTREGALHVAFVLDKSGSMQAVEEAVVAGYNDYLGELRGQGGETRFSLTTFDTSFEHVCVGEPLETVAELDNRVYRPDGMTALYDAIAHTVLQTDQRLQAAGLDDEKVLVVVMTDGLENSSSDYDAHAIAELVRSYDERPNWTFVYLGAGHDSIQAAQDAAARIGYKKANAMGWAADAASTRKSMRSLAHATGARRRAAALKSERFFADADQSPSDYQEVEPPQQASPRNATADGDPPPQARRRAALARTDATGSRARSRDGRRSVARAGSARQPSVRVGGSTPPEQSRWLVTLRVDSARVRDPS